MVPNPVVSQQVKNARPCRHVAGRSISIQICTATVQPRRLEINHVRARVRNPAPAFQPDTIPACRFAQCGLRADNARAAREHFCFPLGTNIAPWLPSGGHFSPL
jgi:hypothetical protein